MFTIGDVLIHPDHAASADEQWRPAPNLNGAPAVEDACGFGDVLV